jgi:hypothetical protein
MLSPPSKTISKGELYIWKVKVSIAVRAFPEIVRLA